MSVLSQTDLLGENIVTTQIHSDLLFTQEDGTKHFVHDTYRDYFTASFLFSRIRASSSAESTIRQAYDAIVSRDDCDMGHDIAWFTSNRLTSQLGVATFLDEMISNESGFTPALFDALKSDSFLKKRFSIMRCFSAGRNSPVVIHINPTYDIHCSLGDTEIAKVRDYINVFSHLSSEHGIDLYFDATQGKNRDSLMADERKERVLEKYVIGGEVSSLIAISPLEYFLYKTKKSWRDVSANIIIISNSDYDDLKNAFSNGDFTKGYYYHPNLGSIRFSKENCRFMKGDMTCVDADPTFFDYETAFSIGKNSIRELNLSFEKVAVLYHSYYHSNLALNPFRFLSSGISYILLEPKINQPFETRYYTEED